MKLEDCEKGYQAPTEGGREGKREGGDGRGGRVGHQMPLTVDFPHVQPVHNNYWISET